ncbi:MAG: amylo-alpha-1,6-glucosidase [Terriglobales bacterium]
MFRPILVTLLILICCLIAQGEAQRPSTVSWQGDLSHHFFASHGRRGFLFTIGAEGAEGYLYPFRVFHDLRVTFRTANSGPLDGRSIAQNATVTPSTITRLYAADSLRVRETLFVPVDQPVLMLLYEVESAQPVNIDVSFRPDFDLMWPAGIGGQTYSWDDARHCFLMEEPSNTYHGRICSPAVTSHSDPADRTQPWNTDRVLSFELVAKPHEPVPVIATIGMPRTYNALDLYSKALTAYPSWLRDADTRYQQLLRDRLHIETGDRRTDDALAWATVALDQAQACNPDLGCGLVGGYGPTFDTRRPQYAWFFAGDALVTISALEAEGAHDETLLALAFIRRYQNAQTGAIWHEISQAANYVDWFHRYPYIYRHTDISPLYLVTMRDVWRSSGDRTLLERSWPSLEAAWRFCLAPVDPHDGLIIIPPDQSGVNENEADRTEKELPLEIVWASGAEAFSELASAMNKPDLSAQAHDAAAKAKASLSEFWDPGHNYYFEGLLAGNRAFLQQMASPAAGVAAGLFPPREQSMVLDRLTEPAFQTAWGIRSIPSDDPHYQPDSYAHGSVWPLGNETYILAALKAHRPEEAWPIWQSLIDDSYIDSPGHIPEVLSGAFYRPLDVAVPEQTWSSAALLTATVRGILGLDPDAPNNKLLFEPHLSPQWSHVTVRNFRLGQRRIDITLTRNASNVDIEIANEGDPFQLTFAPMVNSNSMTATVDGRKAQVSTVKENHDTHAHMNVTVNRSLHIVMSAK